MIMSHSNIDKSDIDTADESPLEVLSRAATMVQQEHQHQVELADESNKINKQTTKWKRDRRRLPEYSRKSDPKVPETLGVEPSSPEASISNGNLNGHQLKKTTEIVGTESPLDMSIKQRGLPPSYVQTISNPGYRSNYRPTVIHNGVSTLSNGRDELPSGISMCDPVIEEHFRRSLGNDYNTIFQNSSPREQEIVSSSSTKDNLKVVEFMDPTGLSVDDHFAKALGDTWKKLTQKDEPKNLANESNLVSAKN